jgi:CBS domain-containing protein
MRIGELMSSPALTVWSWRPVSEAGRLLLRQGVTALCVVNGDGRLLGIVSRSDLLRHRLVPDPRGDMVPTPSDPTPPRVTVADVMTKDVVALSPATDEAVAAAIMLERGIRSIPVVEDGRLLGVVSVTDMLRAAVRGDERIVEDVRASLQQFASGREAWSFRVDDGVVTIEGATSPEERETLQRLAETVPGVVRVRYREDGLPAPRADLGTGPHSDQRQPPGPTDRRGLLVLDTDECLRRLRSAPVGRLAFVRDGDPVVLPVNHGLDGMRVVFRTTWGSKLEVAQAAGTAAFEVDGFDDTSRTGWSVLVRGRLSTVYEADEIRRYEALDVYAWTGPDADDVWIVLRPDEITGREISTQAGAS